MKLIGTALIWAVIYYVLWPQLLANAALIAALETAAG